MIEQDLSPISQESDYLGELKAKLRDLSGFDTLANELTQNADDARATQILFDVRDDALIVENDAVFKDCGDVRREECPWLADGVGHKCDFHRFRRIAGGDKGNQEGVTGVFGIGFVSVYQITNNPELISAEHHWRMHPDASASSRIRPQPVNEFFDGTRFIFPWATNPDCSLRIRLGSKAIRQEQIGKFAEDISASLPRSLLFLRHVCRVEIRRNGVLTKIVERTREGNTTTIFDGEEATSWQIFEGNFDAEAASLKALHKGFINPGRMSSVFVAICHDSAKAQGLYYATLPTQHHTGLPIHVNADFYPQSSRKHLAMSAGYEGAWNEAAIIAAADTLASALPELANRLGYEGVWRLISQVEQLHHNALPGQNTLFAAAYWDALKPVVSRSAIVYTSKGEWRIPEKVHLLENREKEQPCLPILEQLDLSIVHPKLNTYFRVLRSVGVSLLNAFHLSDALIRCGLDKPISCEEAPQWLCDPEQNELLAREISILLERSTMPNASLAKKKMAECAIAKSVDGMFCPSVMLWNAQPEVVSVFEPLGMAAAFAAFDNPAGIKNLIKFLDIAGMLSLLEEVPPETFVRLWEQNESHILNLIGLCATCKAAFRQDTSARERLRKLKIWCAGGTLHSLNNLVVPGNFAAPISLATLVDERVVAEYHKFLIEDLKAEELTVQHYAGKLIPEWCNSGHRINIADCHRLLAELAKHINALQKETQVQSALAACALIPCRDNTLRNARTVYFDSEEVKALLGENAPIAIIPDESKLSVEPFLKWLGVTALPRPADVVSRISTISQQLSSVTANRAKIQNIFYKLGKYWEKYTQQHTAFQPLRSLKWLPAEDKDDRWFAPSEVHTLLQKHLFETTGLFLDVPYKQQQEVAELRQFLQIETKPSCGLVVTHLLNCVARKVKVNTAVYAFLNEADQLSNPAVQRLKGQACLPLEGVGYVRPDEVFWKEHKFQPYLHSLDSSFRDYSALLNFLQVREEPQSGDAINVLRTIADGNDNKRLDDAKHAIVMECWGLISSALQQEIIEPGALASLRQCKVIPNREKYLQPPGWMFFEDKPNLAEGFADRLTVNVILRTPSTSLGMELAGVRLLSRAVETRLVECTDPKPADDLQRILQERRHLIERVIYPAWAEDQTWNTGALKSLTLQWCVRLKVGYTLKAFNQTHSLEPKSADTFYNAADETLYVLRSSDIPWLDIASGLADIMNRDAEEGTVAPGLFVALSAPSLEKGRQALNKLKVPPLQVADEYEAALSTPVSMGGVDTSETDDFKDSIDVSTSPEVVDEEKQEEQANEPDKSCIVYKDKHQQDQQSRLGATDSNRLPSAQSNGSRSEKPFSLDASDNVANVNNANGVGINGERTTDFPDLPVTTPTRLSIDPHSNALHDPRPPVNPVRRSDREAETQNKKAQRTSPRSAPDHDSENRIDYAGRLRSYVFSTSIAEPDQDTRRRDTEPIDKAGMALVLDFEEKAGRIPEAMPHNNPGYDIYSLDATGENERYIEVKSLSGDWQSKGVLVSATQFRMAQRLGPQFWLYVVERADQEDFCITPIQNPAQRVNEFMFDDGWRACMEVIKDVEEI